MHPGGLMKSARVFDELARLSRHHLFSVRFLSIVLFVAGIVFASALLSYADPYPDPPYWEVPYLAVHYPPAQWPTSDAGWISYTYQGTPIKDKRTSDDPSNGGTAPQNYANISSSCTDQSQASTQWKFDSAANTLFFRWRVEQIPNTYATGPAPNAYQNVDPWKSAQWTVLFDIDGDGYREFAVHIDGSSGLPATPIDILESIYSNTPNQSLDYVSDPNIHRLFHNPTAFVDRATSKIMNFHNSLNPDVNWPNGSAETVWDYGTTRSTNITTPTCNEFLIDYQIPLDMLDATSVGGPKMTRYTPFCLAFVTANSNTDPLQKDFSFDGSFVGNEASCIPCGDMMTVDGGTIPSPVVDWVTAIGCGPATLTAKVRDARTPTCKSAVDPTVCPTCYVKFFYYYDANSNGIADDAGSSWTEIGTGTVSATDPSIWTRSWNSSSLKRGQYLIGIEARNSQGNITQSWLTTAGTPPTYQNASPEPGVVFDIFNNSCGTYASVSKTVSPSHVSQGNTVDFTITINNATSSAITVTSISDILPPNFTYVSNTGGSLTPSTSPSAGAGGTITWTFSPAASIGAGSTGTIIFRADTDNVPTGTYSNTATSVTSEGALTSNPVDVGVGAPRLTINKTASKSLAAPGDTITYTITYSNDSPINTTGVTITDPLPIGLTFVSASNGGVYNSSTNTITWTLPNLASGEGPYTIFFDATVNISASVQPQNSACIDSVETSPACSSAVVNIDTPLKIQKSVNSLLISPGNQATFTISYTNSGPGTLTNTTLTDPLPVGFTYVSSPSNPPTCPVAGTYNAGTRTVTWNIGSLASGASGSCALTVQASNPYTGSYPATNTTTITADNTIPVSDSSQVTVTQSACTSPVTYHTHSQTANVGFDGTKMIANTTAPASATDQFISSPQGATSPVPFAWFYQDPATSYGGTISSASVTYWAQKTQGNPTVYIDLYDYDPSTGTRTSLGNYYNGGAGGNITQYTYSLTLTGSSLSPGHRLLWVFSVQGNGSTIDFHYDSTTYDSTSAVCLSEFHVALNKTVDKITANQGNTLAYTITFANSSTANVTGVTIVDTLPAGVTFNSATMNGTNMTAMSPLTNCPPTLNKYCASGQVYTFEAHSSGAAAGVIAAGATGTLVVNVTVENPIVFDHNPLINTAELRTSNTDPMTASATTNILGVPILGIKKRAGATLLKPGDTVTFYLDVVNIGSANAANYTVTADYTGKAYYTFSSASDSGTNSCVGSACTVTWSLTNLAAGGSRTVSYTMQIASTTNPPDSNGVPVGFNEETDHAHVTYGPSTTNSNDVTVTISTNPNLRITKSVTTPAAYSETVCGPNCGSTADKTLANIPVQAEKVRILVNGVQAGVDSGSGVIIGNNFENSTINYTTGALHLDFITTPAAGDVVTVSYNKPAAPGDSLTYTMVVTNIGGTTAHGVLVTDPVPSDTTYNTGSLVYDSTSQTDIIDGDNAYFDGANNRVVFTIGTLAAGASHALNFSVTIASSMPSGTTTLTNNATASASDTASKIAIENFQESAAPVLAIHKSAPALLPYPYTTANGTQNNVATVNVRSSQFFVVGDVISVDGAFRTVTAIPSATQITVNSSVSINTNRPIYGTIRFMITYSNTGSADASNVIVADVLSASPQLNYVQASPAPTFAPAQGSNGTVTWNLGTIAAGQSGTIQLWAIPSATGTYLNTATIDSDQTSPVTSNQTSTKVGVLTLTKSTSTPNRVNNGGTTATYTITLVNQLSAAATTVSITDTLPEGFTYASTSSYTGCGGTTTNPAVGSTTPAWTCSSLAGSGTITITFVANIAATVGAGTYQNPVTAASGNTSVMPFDEINTTAEDVTVTLPADIAVHKAITRSPYTCAQGTCIDFRITATNVGTSAATNISLKDTDSDGTTWPPLSLTYVSGSAIPSTGTFTAGTGIWSNIPSSGSLAAGASATLDLTFSISSLSATLNNRATLIASTPADTNSANNTYSVALFPTRVIFSDFRAYNDNGRVIVQWETASEHNTLGFHVFRFDETSGDFRSVTSGLLPALLTDTRGGTYSLVDSGALPGATYQYKLVEVERNGKQITYGPITVTVEEKTEADSLDPRKSSGKTSVEGSSSLSSGYSRKRREQSALQESRLQAFKTAKESARLSIASETNAGSRIKIPVSENGVYFVDAIDISSLLGLSSSRVSSMIGHNQLSVSNQGKTVSYLPAGNNAGIYFYGTGTDSVYTRDNIYWIDTDKGTVMNSETGVKPSPAGDNQTFTDTLHVEQDVIANMQVNDPAVDYWVWDLIFSSPGYSDPPREFTFTVNGRADTDEDTATIQVHLVGGSNSGIKNDHHVKVSLNDQEIGEGWWSGMDSYTLVTPPFSPSLIKDGENKNTLKVTGLVDLDAGVPFSMFLIDSFDLTYERLYDADGSKLFFTGDRNQTITVGGFTTATPDILLFNITDPIKPNLNTATTIDGSPGSYRISFKPSSADARYLAVASDSVTKVSNGQSVTPSHLHSRRNAADYLIIAPADLVRAAQSLADYRRSQGMKAMVVKLDDIMNEFNYGLSSPDAIRQFLTVAYHKWKKAPRYVVLAGDGTWDYRDNMGAGGNLIPPALVPTLYGLATSDNNLADIDGDHMPDMAIGRLPVLTSQELQDVIGKIKTFESSRSNQVILLADIPDEGGEFTAESVALAGLFPPEYVLDTVYLADHSFEDAKTMLSDYLNGGAVFFNYVGHGAFDSLSKSFILANDYYYYPDALQVDSLVNSNGLPVMVAMTCVVGEFAMPGYLTLSESMVLKADGGAAAVWSATGLSDDAQANVLNTEFYKAIFLDGKKTLGDAVLQAFAKYKTSGSALYMMDTYAILGDPALRIK